MLGPSGPRRLRLAVEHLCQVRGGICFCVDLDPRWVIKLIKKGWMEHLEAYKKHVRRSGGDHPPAPATTSSACSPRPSCWKASPTRWRRRARRSPRAGITGIFSGGTEFTPQWTRFAMEELLGARGVYMTPTYGNTLMGLACSSPSRPPTATRSPTTRRSPAPSSKSSTRSTTRVVDYGQTGRVRLTTLTKEFFTPGFLERDEGEREAALRSLSVGRRQRRASLQPPGGGHDGRRLLTGPTRNPGREASDLHCPYFAGAPFTSRSKSDELRHFLTGEPVARVSQANGGLVQKDMRKAPQAREALRAIPPAELIRATQKAADLYLKADLPLGDGRQSAEDFARQQSATTGLPEHMCRGNMEKNHFVLTHMAEILDALTRGLDPNILARGWGKEHRGVVVSYQAQTPVLGLVLPSNSPGVHTLWLAGHPDADRPGAQAGAAGTVDALSHGGGLRGSGHSPARPFRFIPAARTSGRPWFRRRRAA
jgi:hypothetical protein